MERLVSVGTYLQRRDDDSPGSLEDLFVGPVGMLLLDGAGDNVMPPIP